MKRINIFKAGTHTSAGGDTLSFSEADLQASVDSYDPALHEAPVTVGHPKDNLPAYGWISSLNYSDERGLDATPAQIEPEFADMVKAGRFKKVSASFYGPDAPNNPAPGNYYLRHVGFLGAAAPAVKGLKPVEFSEAEQGVVEFVDAFDTQDVAGVFRKLREFIIDKFSKDEADEVIPSYTIDGLECSARRQLETPVEQPETSFNDPNGDTTMTKEELEQRANDLQAREDKIASQETNFSEREKSLKAAEATQRRAGVTAKVDALVQAGKVLPAEKERITEFACSLQSDAVVEFGEGEHKQKVISEKAFFEFLEGLGARVDTREHSKHEETPSFADNPGDLAKQAVNYREEQAAKGIVVSATEAVAHVQKQQPAE